jgi:hypothetical protein
MLVHFPGEIYERLRVLATRDEISVAAFVAREMTRLAKERVSVEYTVNEDEEMKDGFAMLSSLRNA